MRGEQDQTIAELSNLRMQHQLQSLEDELKLTRAKLEAEILRIRLEKQNQHAQDRKAVEEYLQASNFLRVEHFGTAGSNRRCTILRIVSTRFASPTVG